MRALFCAALGPRLLYAFEREQVSSPLFMLSPRAPSRSLLFTRQYREILQKFESDKLSEVYGAEHLLRLLCKLCQGVR
jgi:hypothetical protein